MTTKKELAESYAAEIRAAVRLTKVAKAERSTSTPELGPVLRKVLRQVDGTVYEETGKALSDTEKAEVLGLIDGALGVRPGQLAMIKKGSVESLIAFDAAVQALLVELTSK